MVWPSCGRLASKSCACGPFPTKVPIFCSLFSLTTGMRVPIHEETSMKIRNVVLAGLLAAVGVGAYAQAKEQFFPLLSYRTGAYAPNGTPWANGKQDYLKMVIARDGGINGVKLTYEECETG